MDRARRTIVAALAAIAIMGPMACDEPMATRRVNDVADALATGDAGLRLEQTADAILHAYLHDIATLPRADFDRGHLLPGSEIPEEFHAMGGSFGEPEVLLRQREPGSPPAVVLSWGHMRNAIIVYAEAPSIAPSGFFVRRVSDRTYVVANES